MVYKNANRNAASLYSHRSITRNNFVLAGNCTCHINVLTTTKRFSYIKNLRYQNNACSLWPFGTQVVYYRFLHGKNTKRYFRPPIIISGTLFG